MALPDSIVDAVLASPNLLGSPAKTLSLGISSETATMILTGYHRGFRIVFILNAALAAFAAVVGFWLVQDEDLSKAEEKEKEEQQRKMDIAANNQAQQSDIEAGVVSSDKSKQ